MSYAVNFDNENIDSFYYWNEYSISLANNSLKSKLAKEELASLRASYYNNLAVYWQKLGEVHKGMNYMDSAIFHGQKMKDDTVLAIFYNNIGTMYQDLGDVYNAEKNHNAALKIRLTLGDSSTIANSYNNIGFMYYRQKLYDDAMRYYRKSIQFYESSSPFERSVPTLNTAMLYRDIGQLDSFKLTMEEVYNIAVEAKNDLYIHRSYLSISQYYLETGQLDTTLYLLNKAKSFFEEHINNKRLAGVYSNLSKVYLKKGEKNKSLDYAWKSKEKAELIDLKEIKVSSYKVLYEALNANNDFKNANIYLNKYYSLSDSLQNEQFVRDQMYKENQLNFKIEKDSLNHAHEMEMILADEKIKSEKQYRIFLIIGIVAGLFIAFVLIRNYRLKQKYIKENYEKEQLLNVHLTEELKAKSKKLVSSSVKNIKTQAAFEEIEKLIEEASKMDSDEVHQNVNRIKNEIRFNKISDKKIENYQERLTKENEDFTVYLKKQYPDLTPKELRLCVLLKMNYSSDEICSILGIAATTLKSSRYRIHKKMNLEKGRRLQDHLLELS